jgi:transcriptional regulator with XRE-family HTH domain
LNFGSNLALALGARGLAQSKLAEKLGVEKSTINKWIKHGTQPELKIIKKVAKSLGVDPISLQKEKPIIFGKSLDLTRHAIEKYLMSTNDSMFFHNFKNQKFDEVMYKLCGIYHSYMPSWVFPDKVNCRVLKIYFDKDSFYFIDSHLAYCEMPSSEYTGYAFRVGNLMHLIGEEIHGIEEEKDKKDEMLFASLIIPRSDDTDIIRGISLGSNALDADNFPAASSYCAIRIKTASIDDDLHNYIPSEPYLETTDSKIRDAVDILSNIPLTRNARQV